MLQELLQIMLLLVNSDLDSSLGKISNVHVVNIPLKQDIIFYMSMADLMDTGIQGETY